MPSLPCQRATLLFASLFYTLCGWTDNREEDRMEKEEEGRGTFFGFNIPYVWTVPFYRCRVLQFIAFIPAMRDDVPSRLLILSAMHTFMMLCVAYRVFILQPSH